jgi:NMD protein affecting ribosome stability and mRNA decay
MYFENDEQGCKKEREIRFCPHCGLETGSRKLSAQIANRHLSLVENEFKNRPNDFALVSESLKKRIRARLKKANADILKECSRMSEEKKEAQS